jgi:Flp pilus assembly pilin Flp
MTNLAADTTTEKLTDKLTSALVAFHRDDAGATATEYIILLILVACFIIAIVKVYGSTASRKYTAANEVVTKDVVF